MVLVDPDDPAPTPRNMVQDALRHFQARAKALQSPLLGHGASQIVQPASPHRPPHAASSRDLDAD